MFEAGRPNGPTARIDGEGVTGQSPPETLLSALATCVSYDVIDILAKQRTPLANVHLTLLDKFGIEQTSFADSTGLITEL